LTATRISHYTLTRKLGAGTYGEVYEAVHQHDPELRVAIKIVAPALVQDPQFVDALKRECRQLDRLRHPNIVAFRDLLVDGDRVAMVLELLRGQDLHHRLSSGPIPVETAASVVEAILDGLGHAHAAGVLHRDIKPGNVYWCDDGRVVLLDFGIARAADGTQATKTGHMVGTFDYMAPERLSGSGGTASSDVYAVGLVAWELLRGRAACPEGEVGRKLMWHMVEGVGAAAKIAVALPGCPTWFAEVIAALAAKDPAARPADGSAALALLREKRAGATATQAQPPAARRPPPSTVMGPVAVGSVPPVAVSVPPVSVPPSNTGRSAPPGTVMGPASVPTPSAPLPSPGRSAPPGTVMGVGAAPGTWEGALPRAVAAGGAGDAPPAAQGRLHERLHSGEPSSEPLPGPARDTKAIFAGRALAVVAWWCCDMLIWTLMNTGTVDSVWGAGYQIPLVGIICSALGWHACVRLAGVWVEDRPWILYSSALSACLCGTIAGSLRVFDHL
jgi:serine/threonine-protein kinase